MQGFLWASSLSSASCPLDSPFILNAEGENETGRQRSLAARSRSGTETRILDLGPEDSLSKLLFFNIQSLYHQFFRIRVWGNGDEKR